METGVPHHGIFQGHLGTQAEGLPLKVCQRGRLRMDRTTVTVEHIIEVHEAFKFEMIIHPVLFVIKF